MGLEVATVRARHHTYRMAVFQRNDFVSQTVRATGKWEIDDPQEIADVVGASLPAPGVFLDVGGNLGYYSLLFAKHGYRTITIEPMWQNRAAINASLCLNPELRARVTVVPVAIGTPADVAANRSCWINSRGASNLANGVMQCARGGSCHAWLTDLAIPDRSKFPLRTRQKLRCSDVELATVDQVLERLAPRTVDVVKVDVEASECKMLAGSTGLLSRYRPRLVQIEVNDARTNDCVLDAVRRHVYTLSRYGLKHADRVLYAAPEPAGVVRAPGAAAAALELYPHGQNFNYADLRDRPIVRTAGDHS